MIDFIKKSIGIAFKAAVVGYCFAMAGTAIYYSWIFTMAALVGVID